MEAPSTVPTIFSPARQLAASRRAIRRQGRTGAAQFVFSDMREEVKERLSFMQFVPQRALVIGDPTSGVARDLTRIGTAVQTILAGGWAGDHPLDIDPVDLIVHDTSLATINDLPGALLHLRAALAPRGMLMASILGAGSLLSLRSAIRAAENERAYPRFHPQIDNRIASALLQRAGFARQVVDTHELRVRYQDLPTLISDLRDQGLTSTLTERAPSLSRAYYASAAAAFAALAEEDGRVTERFVVINLTAWKS